MLVTGNSLVILLLQGFLLEVQKYNIYFEVDCCLFLHENTFYLLLYFLSLLLGNDNVLYC